MRKWFQQVKLKRGVLLSLVIVLGLATILATHGPITESLRGVATALSAAWRGSGNAILTLDSDIKQGVSKTIDFTNEPYPPNNTADDSFYTRARINDLMGGNANLQNFKLLCGVDTTTEPSEPSRVTDIVYWLQDYWEGTSQRFSCGPSNTPTYEVSGTTINARSFCLVTDKTSNARRLRCLNGPRCDDRRKNGNESDRDCGGSCAGCGVGRICTDNNDCASGSCRSGTCRAPSCSDGVKNQNETAVDCGGSCNACANGLSCSNDNDCQSGNCQSGTCEFKPTCSGAAATNSARTHTVLVDLINSCGGYVNYFANNLSEAKSCASTAGHSVPSQMCNYDVLMETSPDWYVTIYASSTSKAVTCAKNAICGNCSPQAVNRYGCATQ